MRKSTLLSALLLLVGYCNAWGQTHVTDVATLTEGTIVALQCRDTNGGAGYYFNGINVKTSSLEYSNFYKIRKTSDGKTALQSLLDGNYVGIDGTTVTNVPTLATAAAFEVMLAEATDWTTVMEGTDKAKTIRFTTGGNHLNAQPLAVKPKYAGGTGGYSVWYVYSYTTEQVAELEPYFTFESYNRGGVLTANGESGNLQHEGSTEADSKWHVALIDGADGVKLSNESLSGLYLAGGSSFTAEGTTWYLVDSPYAAGYKVITQNSDIAAGAAIDANNYNSGTGTWSHTSDDWQGTAWRMAYVSKSVFVRELLSLIEEIRAGVGDGIGYYDGTTAEPILSAAESVANNSASSIDQLQDEIAKVSALNIELPQDGKFYMIVCAYSGYMSTQGVEKAMYSDGAQLKWGTLDAGDSRQIWTASAVDGGFKFQNYEDEKYMKNGSTDNVGADMVRLADEGDVVNLTLLAPGQFKLVVAVGDGRGLHTGGHGNGASVSGNVVHWNTEENGASAWFIREVSDPSLLADVTYHYLVDGVEKATRTGKFSVSRPELIPTIEFVKNGAVTVVDDTNVNIACTYDLPFTPSASFAAAKWYIMDMHSNDSGTGDISNGTNQYIWTYNAEDADVVLPKVPATEVNVGYMPDNRLWAIVGNPFDGFKIYNKAAGEGLTLRKAANGNTASVMSATDDRNVFQIHTTTSGIENSVAFKLADDNNYVNTQAVDGVKVLRGWTDADGGSSIRFFEVKTAAKPGSFIALKGAANERYLAGNTKSGRMYMTEGEMTSDNIFYYDTEKHLLNYVTGLYSTGTYSVAAAGVAGDQYDLKYNSGEKIYVKSNFTGGGQYLYNHSDAPGSESLANRNSAPAGDNTNWYAETVTALPVTVTDAGYATLYAPVALTVPAGVEVYTGAIEGEWLMLTAVEGTIPANAAVVVKSAAGTYSFAFAAEDAAAIENNVLQGAVNTQLAPADAYTLQNPAEGVGMYPFDGENVKGFKAYMTNAAGIKGFLFDIDGALTGIESVEAEGENAVKVIYDLNGRRVERAVKGIYIVNGKKVLVK